MGKVADALGEWADEHDMEWARRDAALAWAGRMGDDMRRAWDECPRADDLMALAGLLQAPMKLAIVATGRLARPSLALVTRKDALATRAVYLAETWSAATERPAKAVGEQLAAHIKRSGARYDESVQRMSDASVKAIEPLVRAEITERADRLRALAGSDDDAWIADEVARTLATPDARERLIAFGREVQSAQREMARVTALAATLELCRAVESAHLAVRAVASVFKLSDEERAEIEPDVVEELARGAVTAEVEAFGLLSAALGMLADAHGRDAVARWCVDPRDESFLLAAARTVFETAAHSLGSSDEPMAVFSVHVEIERVIERERGRRHRAMADALRGEIPYESLVRRAQYE